MKSYLARLLTSLLVALLAGPAQATLVTYTFSGTLTDIRQSGAGMVEGRQFTATYTHDDAQQIGYLIEPGRAALNGGQLSVTVDGETLVGTPISELQVFNDWSNETSGYFGVDGFFVSSWASAGAFSYLLQFDLWDFTQETLASTLMPTQQQVVELSKNGRIWIRQFSGFEETGLAAGHFEQLIPENAVPEPGSDTTIGLGLLLIVAVRSFKRRSSGVAPN